MPREFMIGTLNDKPLLKTAVNEVVYFVDLDTNVVYEDKPGMPVLADEDSIKQVVAAVTKSA